MSFLFRTKRVL